MLHLFVCPIPCNRLHCATLSMVLHARGECSAGQCAAALYALHIAVHCHICSHIREPVHAAVSLSEETIHMTIESIHVCRAAGSHMISSDAPNKRSSTSCTISACHPTALSSAATVLGTSAARKASMGRRVAHHSSHTAAGLVIAASAHAASAHNI